MIGDPGCNHGITFDEAEAKRLASEAPKPTGDPVDFIMGCPSASEIRKRWPRGYFTDDKPCPTCGFVGIYYASYAHYGYGYGSIANFALPLPPIGKDK